MKAIKKQSKDTWKSVIYNRSSYNSVSYPWNNVFFFNMYWSCYIQGLLDVIFIPRLAARNCYNFWIS